jgi:hypothetical protein
MTYDKIKHYLGENITSFIASLNAEQLAKMKKAIIEDMNLHTQGSEIMFKRTVELEFINNLLK